MPHPNRARRKKNEQRRKRAEEKQTPVPPAVQARRAVARSAAHFGRYPVPPLYRVSYEHPVPEQPDCYASWRGLRRRAA